MLAALTNIGTAADIVYTLPAAVDTVFLEDDGTSGNGMLQLRSANGTFDTTVFANPSGSLTINRGNAADTLNVNALPDFSASLTIGSIGNPFSSIVFAGTLTLAADKNLSASTSGVISLPGAASSITTQGAGAITLQGDGSLASGASLTSDLGDITIDNSFRNIAGTFRGIEINGASITSNSGNISLTGFGGNSGSGNRGVAIGSGALITTGDVGQLSINGIGGSSTSGSSNDGMLISGRAHVQTTGTGKLALVGRGGGNSQSASSGIIIRDVDTKIHSAAGYLVLSASGGGSADGTICGGLLLSDGASITSDSGVVDINGYGSEFLPSSGFGVLMFGPSPSLVSSTTNFVSMRGFAENSTNVGLGLEDGATILAPAENEEIRLYADRMAVANTATISAPSGVIQILADINSHEGIDLGATTDAANNTLEISDAELDRMTAMAFTIGSRIGGPLVVSADITRSSYTSLNLYALGTIDFAGGSITNPFVSLFPGDGTTVQFPHSGVDVNTAGGVFAEFDCFEGGQYLFAINGTTPDAQYDQLNVVGPVSISSTSLLLTGNYAPTIGQSFTIINNDGTEAIGGTFDGLPEGKVFSVANGKLVGTFQITYKGGDGNDVVLTAVNHAPTLDPIPDPSPIDEDAGLQTIGLTGLSAGDGESKIIKVTAVSSNPGLIPNPDVTFSAANGTGKLTYKPLPDQNGTAIITVTVQDDGGTSSGGVDTFSQSFTIRVNPVNDPPSFAFGCPRGPDLLYNCYTLPLDLSDEDPVTHGPPAAKSFPFAKNILPGPPNETGTISFQVQNSNPGLFDDQPKIDASGSLTFRRKPNTFGPFILTITLSDGDGGMITEQGSFLATKPHKYHNSADAGSRTGRDVTGATSIQPDGFIVAADVLAVINYINAHGSGPIPASVPSGAPYVDVDADDVVVANDALMIINWISSHPLQSEGEAPADSQFDALSADDTPATSKAARSASPLAMSSNSSVADLVSLIAADIATVTAKRRRP